jgi:uncharacterized protein YggE
MSAKIPLYSSSPNKNKLNVSLDSRKVIIFLVLVIVAMLLIWKPWNSSPKTSDRTVQVNGEATVKAEPDEFVFSPSYEFKDSNKQAALDALSKKSDEIVAKLKKIGVADKDVKTNADGYERGVYLPTADTNQTTYNLTVNVTANSRDQAQKIQDYLANTEPSGAVTPYPTFSQAKKKELANQARTLAESDARLKAEKSAKNLGFKLSSVKTIAESNSAGGVEPLMEKNSANTDLSAPATSSIAVQPGQDEFSYQINVTYYIK